MSNVSLYRFYLFLGDIIMMYKIKKKLNNNVILIKDTFGHEKILIGNGIGFDAKVDSVFKKNKDVRQTFVLSNQMNIESYREIIENTDPELVAFLEEEIAVIQKELGKELNENIHTTLIDHVAFAIERHKKGIDFINPLDSEIRLIYKKEYLLASKLMERFRMKFKIALIDDEIGILAIHIHAASQDENIDLSRSRVKMIQETIQRILEELHLEKRSDSLAYQRLLIHTRYAFDRLLSSQSIEVEDYIMKTVKENYAETFQCIKKAAQKIEKQYDIKIPESEIVYLVIHVNRLIDVNKKKRI